MSTSPWDPRVASEIAQTLATTYRLYATTSAGAHLMDLEVPDGSTLVLTLDEAWTPHVKLETTIVRPDDLDALDPRTGTRLVVELGYVYPGGITDQHRVANLVLDEWEDPLPGATVTVTAYSDEELLSSWESLGSAQVYSVGTPIVDVIAHQLATTLGAVPVVTVARSATLTQALTVGPGATRWDVLKSLANSADVWLYCDALRTWRIAPPPRAAGAPVHHLMTGPGGTVTAAERGRSRTDWGNAVVVKYADAAYAWAWEPSGPMGTATVGVCAVSVPLAAPYPGAALADAGARTILRRVLTRGDTSSITALGAYWVRPGDTLTDHRDRRVIAQRVAFTYPTGLMTITTRTPEA